LHDSENASTGNARSAGAPPSAPAVAASSSRAAVTPPVPILPAPAAEAQETGR